MAVNLKSKSSREGLNPRRNPYFHCIKVGLYVGFRRTEEGHGTWIARKLEVGSKKYVFRSLGTLPGYDEAVKLTEAWAGAVDIGVTHKNVTVEAACKAYVTHQKIHKGKASGADAEGRFKRLVYDQPLGSIALDKLRTDRLRSWMEDQLDDDGDEEDLRKSKDSANRNLNTLKAALNLALKDRLTHSDAGWKTVTPFKKVGRRRDRFLEQPERTALLTKCGPDLAALVKALLLTAVRPGEIANATVGDFNKAQGTLTVTGKTGTRTVTLSTAAVAFLAEQSKNKLPAALLLTDAFGNRWNKD